MDSRTARRAAEKAARDLITSRAALVGELGVLHAERARLATDTDDATERGRQLVADAQAQAAHLVAAARDLSRDADQRYTHAYDAATSGGWTPTDLTALGFQPAQPAQPANRRRRSTSDAAPPLTASDLPLPQQTPGTTDPADAAPVHAQPAATPREPPRHAAAVAVAQDP